MVCRRMSLFFPKLEIVLFLSEKRARKELRSLLQWVCALFQIV